MTPAVSEIFMTHAYSNIGPLDLEIIAELLPKAKRYGSGYMACCPVHDDSTPSLSLNVGSNGKLLAKCFAGCSFAEIMKGLEGITGGGILIKPQSNSKLKAEVNESNRRAVINIWSQCKPVTPGDSVHTYLTETRRIPLESIPADIRFHAHLEYWIPEGNRHRLFGCFPAMVAAFRNIRGEIVGVHQTYLSDDSIKLNQAYPKLAARKVRSVSTELMRGAGIRLGHPMETLVIGEGVETSLAASLLAGFPSWAAYCANNLAAMQIPDAVRRVIICVDNDAPGKRSSRALGERLRGEGRRVQYACYSKLGKGRDWADFLEMANEQ